MMRHWFCFLRLAVESHDWLFDVIIQKNHMAMIHFGVRIVSTKIVLVHTKCRRNMKKTVV